MTRLTMFAIYDSKAALYLKPFFSQNTETAIRDFTSAVNTEGQFNEFAEDYSVFLLGEFDQEEGTLRLESAPIHVCNAITLKAGGLRAPTPLASVSDANAQTRETTATKN